MRSATLTLMLLADAALAHPGHAAESDHFAMLLVPVVLALIAWLVANRRP